MDFYSWNDARFRIIFTENIKKGDDMASEMIEKIKKENEGKRVKKVTIVVSVEAKLGEDLEYLIKNCKGVLERNSEEFLAEKLVESQRKFIQSLVQDMKEEEGK